MDSKFNAFGAQQGSTSLHPVEAVGFRPMHRRAGTQSCAPAIPVGLPASQTQPAGGFGKVNKSLGLELEDDKPLADLGARLPDGAFTPLPPAQCVISAVRLMAESGADRSGLVAGFGTLISTRVAAGMAPERVAVALFQAIEAEFGKRPKDGKHGETTGALALAQRAAFEALAGSPGVNMEDMLRPVLAESGAPDVPLCAWLLAQQDEKGLIRADLWGTAMDHVRGVAHQARKSHDWTQLALTGVGQAAAAAPMVGRQAALDHVAQEVCRRVPVLTPQQIEAMLAQNTRDRQDLGADGGLESRLTGLLEIAMTPNAATPARVSAVLLGMRNAFHPAGPEKRQLFARAADAAIKAALNKVYGPDNAAGTDMVTKTDMRRALFGRLADGVLKADPPTATTRAKAGGQPAEASIS